MSEAARQFLAIPARPPHVYPARDDVDEWTRYVEQVDAQVAAMWPGRSLPVAVEDTTVAGVHTYVLRPEGIPDTGPVYLELHGGGLILCGGEQCARMAGRRAMTAGMTTWAVDYRMPPRHPHPAALDDVTAVYRALLAVRDPGRRLRRRRLGRRQSRRRAPRPGRGRGPADAGGVGTDDAGGRPDRVRRHLPDPRRRRQRPLSLREVNELYAAGHDLAHPYLSPLFADLSGFPPTFLQSGTRDLFLSNTVRMHRKLLAAGVEAELHVFEAMPHGGFGGSSPEDAELDAAVRRFLDRHRR